MPSKTDKIAIESSFLKRSSKLIPCQKEMIKWWKENSDMSINSIAKMFKVSKRTIQFILYPERLELNKFHRETRGGSNAYYVKKDHTKSVREHRQYKKDLFKNI